MRRFTNLETQPIQTLGYVCILVVTLIFLIASPFALAKGP